MTPNVHVTGFPHSGTSALYSLIASCSNSKVYPVEKKSGEGCTKWPFALDTDLNDRHVIFVMRHPVRVYYSLYKRFNCSWEDLLKMPEYSVSRYRDTMRLFNSISSDKILAIKYDEMFHDGLSKLKAFMKSAGLEFDDSIFIEPMTSYIPKEAIKDIRKKRRSQTEKPFEFQDDSPLPEIPEKLKKELMDIWSGEYED